MHTLENHLQSLDRCSPYIQWFAGQVDDSKRMLPFFYRNVLDCVRYLLCQIAYLTWSTAHSVNLILMLKGYMRKCILLTGGGIFKYSGLASYTVTLAD